MEDWSIVIGINPTLQHSTTPLISAVFDLNLRNFDLACCYRTHQPPAAKLKSEIPRYHARICLLFIGLTSYRTFSAKRVPIGQGRKKPMEKVRTVGCLARLKTELGRPSVALAENSTSAVDEIAQEYAFL
jgi:hypothetical protein